MEILHNDDGNKGVFYIEQNGERLAEMTYKWNGNSILIDRTRVSDALSGKGIGKLLVNKGVEFARTHHITIIPICPFVEKVLKADSNYQDVLQP